ncbi:MAG: MFS transporter [Actinocrinis sp.]
MQGNGRTGAGAGAGWTLALASAGSMMVALDGTVVATALSRIRLDLNATIGQLEWTFNAYSLSFAVLLMTGAALGDRFGRRRMFVGGIGLFTAASAWCALVPGIGWLITARAVQGAGAALVMPLAMALLGAAYPPQQRARALGIFAGVTGIAVVAGPLVGGAITQSLGWQWIFWLNVPLGAICIPLVLRLVPESRGPGGMIDGGGLLLVTGGAFGLVWGLINANGSGWGSPGVLAGLVAGAVLLAAFVFWELRARLPMVPMNLFRSRGFSAGNVAALFMYSALYGALFFVAQFLQTAQGDGPLKAGVHLIAWGGGVTIVAPLAGRFANRIGARRLAITGLAMQTGGMFWLAALARPDLPYPQMIAPMIVAGCGVSMAMPAVQISVFNSVQPAQIGKASGVFNTLRQLGGVLGVAILGLVFSSTGGYRSAGAFSVGFADALRVAAAFSLLGALASLLVPGVRRPAAPPRPIARDAAPAPAPQVVGAVE